MPGRAGNEPAGRGRGRREGKTGSESKQKGRQGAKAGYRERLGGGAPERESLCYIYQFEFVFQRYSNFVDFEILETKGIHF